MKRFDMRILWGGLLICVGGLFLLQELDLITSAWGIIWTLVFIAAGSIFIYTYFRDRSQWWPLIPGLGLIGLGILIFIDDYFPGTDWSAAIFLGAIGLSFWLVYVLNQENWWAVIPAGVLTTLTLVVAFEPVLHGDADGGVFLLGMGVTFFLLGVLPTTQGRMRWSFIPAAVLSLIGILLLSSAFEIFNYIWPTALILLGGYFILRNLTKS
jgi:hypothetical protein